MHGKIYIFIIDKRDWKDIGGALHLGDQKSRGTFKKQFLEVVVLCTMPLKALKILHHKRWLMPLLGQSRNA